MSPHVAPEYLTQIKRETVLRNASPMTIVRIAGSTQHLLMLTFPNKGGWQDARPITISTEVHKSRGGRVVQLDLSDDARFVPSLVQMAAPLPGSLARFEGSDQLILIRDVDGKGFTYSHATVSDDVWKQRANSPKNTNLVLSDDDGLSFNKARRVFEGCCVQDLRSRMEAAALPPLPPPEPRVAAVKGQVPFWGRIAMLGALLALQYLLTAPSAGAAARGLGAHAAACFDPLFEEFLGLLYRVTAWYDRGQELLAGALRPWGLGERAAAGFEILFEAFIELLWRAAPWYDRGHELVASALSHGQELVALALSHSRKAPALFQEHFTRAVIEESFHVVLHRVHALIVNLLVRL
jgi:hypothetical protein